MPTLILSISTFTNQTTLTAKDFLKPKSRNLCQFPGASRQLSSSSPASEAPSTRAGREESGECEGFIVCFRLSWSSALHMWTHCRHTMFWKGGIVMSTLLWQSAKQMLRGLEWLPQSHTSKIQVDLNPWSWAQGWSTKEQDPLLLWAHCSSENGTRRKIPYSRGGHLWPNKLGGDELRGSPMYTQAWLSSLDHIMFFYSLRSFKEGLFFLLHV